MKGLNISFSQEVFIKGFELFEGRVAWRFSKLDLSFLEEEEAGDEAGLSSIEANLSLAMLATEVPEPTLEVPEPAESIPTSPAIVPPEVVDLE
ncbi:hypothetical protein COCNU_scaffold005799G000010 [Cocos nucifera]|nr:hypothetical protein [Cocos nucifera]